MAISTSIDAGALRERMDALLPEALQMLRRMVAINSFTLNAAGVDAIGDLTADAFKSLGFTADRPQAIACVSEPRDPLGHHLILTRPGRSGRRIGLVGHMDTVYTTEEEQANDFAWRVAGDRIYGPGTVDMKGGNVLIWMVLTALRDLSPELFEDITWIVMFNAAEEGLDSDFGPLQRKRLGPDAVANLIFEGGGFADDTYYLIAQRKGSAGLRATAHGRSAHAGVDHEKGANAIVQLSEFVQRISRLTDYDRQLTCNVGVIRGGVVANRVPDYAEALLEMRAFDPEVLEQAVQTALAMDDLSTVASAADGFPARLAVYCRKRLPAWPANPGTERLIRLWQSVGESIGITIGSRARGGLSDGNFTQDLVPTIDGLGPSGGNAHCSARSADGKIDQEYVLPATLIAKGVLNVLAIERLVREGE